MIGHEGAERLVGYDGPALEDTSLRWFDASSGGSPLSSKRSILLSGTGRIIYLDLKEGRVA